MNQETHTEQKNHPKVSIGMPVFNGEKFLRKRLDSVLAQTLGNFELIISDNASTDSTCTICEEYSKKDNRIHYIRQEKNRGVIWNYNFVLEKASCDYFVWAAVDDLWKSDFLKKNLELLESKKNVVCSISTVDSHGPETYDLVLNPIDSTFRNFVKKIRHSLKPSGIYPLTGSYENRVRTFLKKTSTQLIYGIFKTDELRKSFISKSFLGLDQAVILNALRYGEFYVVDEKLMSIFDAGMSKKGIISLSKLTNNGKLGIIFPDYPLTAWCAKNLGIKLFLKNIDYFILLNLWGSFLIIVALIWILVHKFRRNKK